MSFRLFLHIPRNTIKLLLYAVVAVAVLFLALTRTQVGRDSMRAQIERQFNNTFDGQLQIGQLRGNLLNTLYAHNIQLLDSSGGLVASIDAAVLQPTWLELLSGTVSLHRITLIQPEFHLLLRDDSTWNVSDVFKKKTVRAGAPRLGSFTSSDIKILDGSVYTSNLGALPEAVAAGKVFDYTDATISNIQAQMNIEWQGDTRLFDIDKFSLDLDKQNINLADLHGQILWADDRLEFNEVFILAAETGLAFSGYAGNLQTFETQPGKTTIEFDLNPSTLDASQVRQLFPAFPLADTLRIASRLAGQLDALDVQSFEASSGNLRINANGYARGYPDSLSFIAYASETSLPHEDLKRVLPAANFDILSPEAPTYIESMQVRGAMLLQDGAFQQPHYGKAAFELTRAGRIAGNAEFSKDPETNEFAFTSFLQTDSLDLRATLPSVDKPSLLSGTLFAQGVTKGGTFDFSTVNADVQMRFEPSSFGNMSADTLEAFAHIEEGAIDLQGVVRHRVHGVIGANAMVFVNPEKHAIEADLTIAQLNLGSLLKVDSLATKLDGRLNLNAEGSTLADLRGMVDLSVAPSVISWNDEERPVPAHHIGVSFSDLENGRQQLALDGDLATAQLSGQFNLDSFRKTGKSWGQLIGKTVREVINRPLVTDSLNVDPAAVLTAALLQARPGTALLPDEAPDSLVVMPEVFDLDIAFRNADLLHTWLPASPVLGTNLEAKFSIASTPSSLVIAGDLQADSLIINKTVFDNLTGDVAFSTDTSLPAADRFTFLSTLHADSLKLVGQTLPYPTLHADLSDGSGQIGFATKSSQRLGPQRLQTHVEFLSDRNRVHFEELILSVGNSTWTTYAPAQVDIIDNAVIIPGLELQSKSPTANILQSVHLSGILSPNPSDTAALAINNIAIRPISQFLDMQRPLGGLISGQLAVTTINNQPEITGNIDIDRFSLDNRVLGDLNIASQYIPRQPDVGLQIALRPIEEYNQEEFLPDAMIPAQYENNAFTIDGTFRLPRLNSQKTGFLDAGSLDLDLDLARADVFFFEYIFPNFLSRSDGYMTGGGKIVGNFDYPVFDTRLELKEGEIDIPKFNLQYEEFTGVLNIDRNAIRLENGQFKDLTGGVASLEGDFLFNEYRHFSFDLEGQLNELLIMNQDFQNDLPFYGQIWASGSLTLTGPAFNATLISNDAVTKASSELFIPVTEDEVDSDVGFLIFADSSGNIPDLKQLAYRKNLLSKRPEGERRFVDGLSMDLNILAPPGSTTHLVFDPLLGESMNAVGSGRIQIQRREGDFSTFGTLFVESGDYLFTAGDVFARRFEIQNGGTITWDGNPIDARLNIPASYRTRASVAGLPGNSFRSGDEIPLIVQLDITGRVSSPEVELGLRADRSDRGYRNYEGFEAILNQSERLTDYATSVLLTNSFLLTTESVSDSGTLTNSGNQIAFTSVSQLVASQLNRFLGEALPNVDLNLGLQGESLEDPEVTYGVALYLLDERLVIRGEGVYQNEVTENQHDLEGEFEVEVRLNPNVSVSVFLRREGDLLAENALTSTRGAGLSYQTQFSSWSRFFDRLFGWMKKKKKTEPPTDQVAISPNE
ncbi:MAG: translocation/assembly module TamB domain-containing protein [Bacteroidota bacterium]